MHNTLAFPYSVAHTYDLVKLLHVYNRLWLQCL